MSLDKICRNCGEATGRQRTICRPCEAAESRERYHRDVEGQRDRGRRYYEAHGDARRAAMRRYRAERGEEINARRRARRWANPPQLSERAQSRRQQPEYRAAVAAAVRRYRQRHPERAAAVAAVRRALDSGLLIKPSRCQAVGCKSTGRLNAHHDDYGQPLRVQWLCTRCHEHVHHRGPVVLKASAGALWALPPSNSIDTLGGAHGQ